MLYQATANIIHVPIYQKNIVVVELNESLPMKKIRKAIKYKLEVKITIY